MKVKVKILPDYLLTKETACLELLLVFLLYSAYLQNTSNIRW